MLKLKKIAITGGVASGKTTVSQFFRELGAFVVSADAIVHELLHTATDLKQKVIRQLGTDILENGQISRTKVAERVFKDPEQLKALEEILHPAVLKRIEELYKSVTESGKYTSFVVEIPLLFEIGGESFYDVVVAVIADEAIARRRFEKAGFQKQEYDQRMKRQISPYQKSARADYILYNNSSLDDLKRQVASLNNTFQKME